MTARSPSTAPPTAPGAQRPAGTGRDRRGVQGSGSESTVVSASSGGVTAAARSPGSCIDAARNAGSGGGYVAPLHGLYVVSSAEPGACHVGAAGGGTATQVGSGGGPARWRSARLCRQSSATAMHTVPKVHAAIRYTEMNHKGSSRTL